MSEIKVVKNYLQYDVPPEIKQPIKVIRTPRPESADADAAGNAAANAEERARRDAEAARVRLEEARREADALVKAAEDEAARMIEAANRQAEDILRDAQTTGYETGYARGAAEGRADEEAKLSACMDEMAALADMMRAHREECVSRETDNLIAIAMEAARKIMRGQCRLDTSAVSKMLEEVLAEREDAVKLYLSEFQNAIEFRLDKSIADKIRRFAPGLRTVMVKEPDCIMIETEYGVTDISIPTQTALLYETLTSEAEAER